MKDLSDSSLDKRQDHPRSRSQPYSVVWARPKPRPRNGLSTVVRLAEAGMLSRSELRLAVSLIAALEDRGGASSNSVSRVETGSWCGEADKGRTERREAARIDRKRLLQQWMSAVNRSAAELAPVVAVLAGQESLNGLDRRWHRRSGWAKRQVILGLQAMASDRVSNSRMHKLDKRE